MLTRLFPALVTGAVTILSMPAASRGQAVAPYDVVVDSSLMIPVRDGILLSTQLYRPARYGKPVDEPFPVLLQRTPYDFVASAKDAAFFARHGYVVALQNIRGRY